MPGVAGELQGPKARGREGETGSSNGGFDGSTTGSFSLEDQGSKGAPVRMLLMVAGN